MLPSRKSWSSTIQFYWHFSKNWSQIQKVGVKNSKFGVNETSDIKKVGLSIVIYIYKDFDNCSILWSPSLQICRKHKENCYNNK